MAKGPMSSNHQQPKYKIKVISDFIDKIITSRNNFVQEKKKKKIVIKNKRIKKTIVEKKNNQNRKKFSNRETNRKS